MNAHESFRELIVLAAAGVLDADDMRALQQHIRECAGCRVELDNWGAFNRSLNRLPQPITPTGLMERTHARILRAYGERSRHNDWILVGLVAFAWIVSLLFWIPAAIYVGDLFEIPAALNLNPVAWFVVATAAVWITAGTAAIVLGNRLSERSAQ